MTMKNLKTLIITLTFLSLESYAGWFSPEISICDKLEDSVQHRNGRVYLPNQANGFTGLNDCVWTLNEQQSDLGRYSNGKKDGVWTTWYRNGQKESKVDYDDGRKDGKWTHWYENGKKHSEENYDDGVKDGEYIERDSLGNIVLKGLFNNGIKDGNWFSKIHFRINDKEIWSPEDSVHPIFDNGKLVGKWRRNRKGKEIKLNMDGTDHLGEDRIIKSKSSQGMIKNGQKDSWWWVIGEGGPYKDDKKEGFWEFWENGQRTLAGTYKNGKKVGEWRRWDRNDEMTKFDYKDGNEGNVKSMSNSKHPRNIRFDDEILEICERYISTHPDINFSTLVRVAVGSFLASKGCY